VDLEVTVVAKKNAFVELAAKRLPAAQVVACKVEPFGALVDVVKAQRPETSRVTTRLAGAALVVDHLSLERFAIDSFIGTT
jgi:hypothetical protein